MCFFNIYRENGFIFSETDANRLELQSYREDSNSCLSFVKDCCELDSLAEIGVTMLYDKYKIYCQDNGMRPYGKQTFNKELETRNSCGAVHPAMLLPEKTAIHRL